MERRTQEVRPHIILLHPPFHRTDADDANHIHLGSHPDAIGLAADGKNQDSRRQRRRALYEKLQYLVNAIGVSSPTAFRITTGCKSVAQLLEYLQCMVWAWKCGIDDILAEYSMETHGDQRVGLPLHTWAQHLSARTNAAWDDIIFLQIWYTPSEIPAATISVNPTPPPTQPQQASPSAVAAAAPRDIPIDDRSMLTGSSVSTPSSHSRSMHSSVSLSQT
eukprot:2369474-Amphidinium_carterae.1